MTRRPTATEVTFESEGVTCRGTHVRATSDDLSGPAGRPVVVMAHGLGGTVDSGLLPFAEGLAAAGLDVLAFDYRGFGRSDGEPRQTVSVAGQVGRLPGGPATPPAAARASTPPAWCSGASRSPAATSSRSRPTATTSPPWSR